MEDKGIPDTNSLNNTENNTELSDVTIEINVDSMNDICSSWSQKVNSVDISSVDVEGAFSSLNSCGVATSYIPSLKSALSNASTLTLAVSNIIKTALEEQVSVDDSASNADDGSYYSGNYGGGGGSDGGYSDGRYELDAPTTSVDNSNTDLTVNTDMIEKIDGESYDDYSGFLISLLSILKDDETLNVYLDDSKYADILKQSLLNSKSVSNDIKEMIADMDSKILQITIKHLYSSDNNTITDISKSVLYNYTELLAKNSGTSIKDIISSSSVDSFLADSKKVSSSFERIIHSSSWKDDILDIYDGNNIERFDSSSVSVIRNTMEVLSEKKNITSEALLTDSSNDGYLKSELEKVCKSFSFIDSLSAVDSDTSSSILNNLIS